MFITQSFSKNSPLPLPLVQPSERLSQPNPKEIVDSTNTCHRREDKGRGREKQDMKNVCKCPLLPFPFPVVVGYFPGLDTVFCAPETPGQDQVLSKKV